MKRIEQLPTPEAIAASIGNIAVNRNEEVLSFIDLLHQTEGPFTIMLDARWGEGKTFFVKTVEYVLKSANPQIEFNLANHSDQSDLLDNVLTKAGEHDQPILPFYFNAWDNDFADDPISALFANMAVAFDDETALKNHPDIISAITGILDATLSVAQLPSFTKGIASSLRGENLVSAYKTRAELRSRIDSLAREATKEVADKLVIFIDELDRCRPDFSVHLLEQIKTLFQSEDIVVVISTDSSQLANATAGMYGAGYDSALFLQRFYDYRHTLMPLDGYNLAYGETYPHTSSYFDSIISELIERNGLTARAATRLSKLPHARAYAERTVGRNFHESMGRELVLPLLVFIDHEDPDVYDQIVSGKNPDALYNYSKKLRSVNKLLNRVISYGQPPEFIPTEEDRRRYMHDLCILIFAVDRRSEEYSAAEERFGLYDAEYKFDPKIYRTMQFPN